MSDECAACQVLPNQSRWKKVTAWAGLILFCPCHLPLTIAGLLVVLSASGLPIAESWGRPLLYLVFGGAFTLFLIMVLRMVAARRERERRHESEHAPAAG